VDAYALFRAISARMACGLQQQPCTAPACGRWRCDAHHTTHLAVRFGEHSLYAAAPAALRHTRYPHHGPTPPAAVGVSLPHSQLVRGPLRWTLPHTFVHPPSMCAHTAPSLHAVPTLPHLLLILSNINSCAAATCLAVCHLVPPGWVTCRVLTACALLCLCPLPPFF